MLIVKRPTPDYAEIWKTGKDRRRYTFDIYCFLRMNSSRVPFYKISFAISLRGKCIHFIVITFCRYLWNRFQSKTQRNARDSGAEASKAWRRRWGKLFRMSKIVFCAFLAPTVITRGNPMCPFYYLLVRWAYQEMLMLFVRLETVS